MAAQDPGGVVALRKAFTAAAAIFAEVLAGRRFDEALLARRAPEALRPRVRDLVARALRDFGWGDYVLAHLAHRGVAARLRPLLLVVLSAARSERYPAHALVHEAVESARRLHPKWAGLTNALLRRFLAEKERFAPEALGEAPEARWRHPNWWIEALQQRYVAWEQILEAGNLHPPMALRLRSAVERHGVLDALQKAGLGFILLSEMPEAVVLTKPLAFSELPGMVQALCVQQDVGAQRAVRLLRPAARERVLDACAAPGNKALQLWDMGVRDLTLVERDIERLDKMQKRLSAYGVEARFCAADAAELASWWDQTPFDAILLDAPCSASGVVRRHPDIKWLRRASDLAAFAREQRRLLEALWSALRPGGRLLYATCSLFSCENEDHIAPFLQSHPEAVLLQRETLLPDAIQDGFFYALFYKRSL